MTLWRYIAVEPRRDAAEALPSPPVRREGELSAESAAEVRASLRRLGLQVIDLKPLGRSPLAALPPLHVLERLAEMVCRYQRNRRRHRRAELLDGLATLLESGLPLLESVETLASSAGGRRSAIRHMLIRMRESVRAGDSLGAAMAQHPGWFDAIEIAIVRAAQHSGTLPVALRKLSRRQERRTALFEKLLAALTYPAIVLLFGFGVVIFLSVRTLPNLVQILSGLGIEAPRLTRQVITFGGLLADYWVLIFVAIPLLIVLTAVMGSLAERWGIALPLAMRRLRPRMLRRMAVGGMSLQLAELLRSGVPLVDAMRIVAPTTFGSARGGLRGRLLGAADRVEQGESLSGGLDDELYFDAEFRRLLAIGEAGGELDVLLERIGRRYERQAARQIDRLATLLEPAVILALAFLVGIVAMAALLPLIKLREVL